MNLLEMFKSLTDEEKQEFISLIKKERETVIAVSISKANFNLEDYQKLTLTKNQLFGQ